MRWFLSYFAWERDTKNPKQGKELPIANSPGITCGATFIDFNSYWVKPIYARGETTNIYKINETNLIYLLFNTFSTTLVPKIKNIFNIFSYLKIKKINCVYSQGVREGTMGN